MTEFTKEFMLERSQEIGNKFLAWTLETKPCPISINDTYWFKKLCGLFETQALLEQRIAELEQERRWIPVSERLPEDSRIYDVAIAGYEYSWTGTCVFGKWIGESGKAILGVTHWKYRPQPPAEGE